MIKAGRRVLKMTCAAMLCCTSTAGAEPSLNLQNLSCRFLVKRIESANYEVSRALYGQPAVIAELLDETEFGRAFDFLDFSAENIALMSQLSVQNLFPEFYLELPGPCDGRVDFDPASPNRTKFDRCYSLGKKYLLRFRPSKTRQFEMVGERVIEASDYGKRIADGGKYPSGYKSRLIDFINEELRKIDEAYTYTFDLEVVEQDPGDKDAAFPPYYIERKILVDDEFLTTRLRFVETTSGSTFAEFRNAFPRGSDTSVCSAELHKIYDDVQSELFIAEVLTLRTN